MAVTIIEAGDAAAPQAAAPAAPAAPAVPPTPSETLVRAAPARKTARLTLESGRTVTVKRLSPLERMMVAKAVGSELVTNALYANYALVACSITEIEGVAVSLPSSQREIEVLIFRLGDDFDDLTEQMRTAFAAEEVDAFDPVTVKN